MCRFKIGNRRVTKKVAVQRRNSKRIGVVRVSKQFERLRQSHPQIAEAGIVQHPFCAIAQLAYAVVLPIDGLIPSAFSPIEMTRLTIFCHREEE